MAVESRLTDLSAFISQGDVAGVRGVLQDLRGNGEAVAVLVQSGEFGKRGSKSALHVAASRGRATILSQLLATRADPNARDDAMNTPLLLAAELGHARAAHVLLKAGADARTVNAFGSTPLSKVKTQSWDSVCVQTNKAFIERMLAGEGVEYDWLSEEPPAQARVQRIVCPPPAIDPSRPAVEPPLLDLVGRNDVRAVEAFLTNLRLKGGQEAVFRAVIGTDDPLSPSRRRKAVQPALHAAALKGFPQILKILLASDADPNTVNDQGVTPLQLASEAGQWEAAHVLLSAGATVDTQNSFGTLSRGVVNMDVDHVTAAL